jgi:hypothetical protein
MNAGGVNSLILQFILHRKHRPPQKILSLGDKIARKT